MCCRSPSLDISFFIATWVERLWDVWAVVQDFCLRAGSATTLCMCRILKSAVTGPLTGSCTHMCWLRADDSIGSVFRIEDVP